MSDLGVYFGPGTMPDGVREAVEAQVAGARIHLPPPTRERVDVFFQDLADLVKRAEGN